jgi:putative tryptophan/tyrosine transport system substrate-binding protein
MLVPLPMGQRMQFAQLKRREVITFLGGVAAWPLAARAQQQVNTPKSAYRIGFLFAGTLALRPQVQEFWRTLQQLGYIEGKNLKVEVREARGQLDRLPGLASEIVATHPDVIVAVTSPATAAAKMATRDIPIVMAIISDPLGSGFVKSLARPEANITGPSLMSTELTGKRVELIKETLPDLSILGLLWNEKSAQNVLIAKLAEQAASSIGVVLHSLPLRAAVDLDAALDKAFEEHLRAILVANDAVTFDHRAKIIAFSLAKRIPTFHTFPEEALDGALVAYGPKLSNEYGRAALYVAKILSGAGPADLPVDQATHFEFVLNMKTAKAIGVTIPTSILLRANEVIE